LFFPLGSAKRRGDDRRTTDRTPGPRRDGETVVREKIIIKRQAAGLSDRPIVPLMLTTLAMARRHMGSGSLISFGFALNPGLASDVSV
jgi:hypothetical protein